MKKEKVPCMMGLIEKEATTTKEFSYSISNLLISESNAFRDANENITIIFINGRFHKVLLPPMFEDDYSLTHWAILGVISSQLSRMKEEISNDR